MSGYGAVLCDVRGREYFDGNSSIWTNLHGHQHPRINAAIQRQLKRISHSSALGLANEPASLLAERLASLANPIHSGETSYTSPHVSTAKSGTRVTRPSEGGLEKVFF